MGCARCDLQRAYKAFQAKQERMAAEKATQETVKPTPEVKEQPVVEPTPEVKKQPVVEPAPEVKEQPVVEPIIKKPLFGKRAAEKVVEKESKEETIEEAPIEPEQVEIDVQ